MHLLKSHKQNRMWEKKRNLLSELKGISRYYFSPEVDH